MQNNRYIVYDENVPNKLKVECHTIEPEYSLGLMECEWIDCYVLFEDEPGEYCALLSETKHADRLNELAKEEYELRKQN